LTAENNGVDPELAPVDPNAEVIVDPASDLPEETEPAIHVMDLEFIPMKDDFELHDEWV